MQTHSAPLAGDVVTGTRVAWCRRDCSCKLSDVVEELSASTVKTSKAAMALESRITQEEIKKEPEKPIDREKVGNALVFTPVYVHFKITTA